MKSTINKPTPQLRMYETENDIPEQRRSELNALMNQRLADAVDLQMQMKQAHWNVKGPHFIGLHELFDQIDEAVEGYGFDRGAHRSTRRHCRGHRACRIRTLSPGRVPSRYRRRPRARRSRRQSLVHLRTRSPQND